MRRIPSEFWINNDRCNFLIDSAMGWFVKSFKFKHESDEWKICRLKYKILLERAGKLL
jgi:hypothetical protein